MGGQTPKLDSSALASVAERSIARCDIDRLEASWRQSNPRRADGGAYAAGGFLFQAYVGLLKAFTELDALDDFSLFNEVVSDVLTVAEDGVLFVAQVKRNGSVRDVRSALDELSEIRRLAAELTIEFRPCIAIGRTSESAAMRAAEKWAGSDDDRLALLSELDVRQVANPRRELAALLANDFGVSEPYKTVDRLAWLVVRDGAIAQDGDAGSRGTKQARTSEQIVDEIKSITANPGVPSGLYLWKNADQPPSGDRRGAVFANAQPTVAAFRDGNFADRPKHVEELSESLELWLSSRSDDDARIPVFWISGPSGSGKSVLLIQMLARIHAGGADSVVWLGPNTTLLPRAIEWAGSQQNPGQVVIGIDDPMAPSEQSSPTSAWVETAALINALQQRGSADSMPLIVACGPPEQATDLARQQAHAIDVQQFRVRKTSPEDLADLRAWYTVRTGEEPLRADDSTASLVELFFQWQTGYSLDAFSEKFRNRIIALGGDALFDFIRRVLAFNRLNLDYPAHAKLTPQARDQLAILVEEERLTAGGRSGRHGYWLAHPRISDAIYASWMPPQSIHSRNQDFLDCYREALSPDGDPTAALAPLEPIASGFFRGHRMPGLLVDESLFGLLDEIWQMVLEVSNGNPSMGQLEIWVRLKLTCGAELSCGDPVQMAIERLTESDPGDAWSVKTLDTLLDLYTSLDDHSAEEFTDVVLARLASAQRWAGWGTVMQSAMVKTRDRRFLELLKSQSAGRTGFIATPALIARALRIFPDENALQEWAKTWLQRTESPSWPVIWESFWAASKHEDLRRSACDWLSASLKGSLASTISQQYHWSHIWINLWRKKPSPELRQLALDAMKLTPFESPVWGHCLPTLISENDPKTKRPTVMNWRPANTGVSADDVMTLAFEWLANVEDQARNWGFIFEPILRHSDDPAVRQRGEQWLESADPSDENWPWVFKALFSDRRNGENTEIALNWLRANSTHNGWPQIWAFVFDPAQLPEETSAEFYGFGDQWLLSHADNTPGWPMVWSSCVSGPVCDPDVAALGVSRTLSASSTDSAWPLMVEPVTQYCEMSAKQRDELRTLCATWLKDHSIDNRNRDFVLRSAWNLNQGMQEFGVALEWLEITRSPHWSGLWLKLAGSDFTRELFSSTEASPDDLDSRARFHGVAGNWVVTGRSPERAPWDDQELVRWREVCDAMVALDREATHALTQRPPGEFGEGRELRFLRELDRIEPNPQIHQRLMELFSAVPSAGADIESFLSWRDAWNELDEDQRSCTDELAVEWLRNAPENVGRFRVWQQVRQTVRSPQLIEVTERMLNDAAPLGEKWLELWLSLWGTEQSDWLFAVALQALQSVQPDFNRPRPWAEVWIRLHEWASRSNNLVLLKALKERAQGFDSSVGDARVRIAIDEYLGG